jgi:hypothetical protein
MDAAFYRTRLYPFQDRVLACVAAAETGFYLSGGTAASRGYLQHRYSDDLDFFVNDDERFELWASRLLEALRSLDAQVDVQQREKRIVRLQTWNEREVSLKIDLINDVPARVGEIRNDSTLGRVDSAENILADRVSAALDRSEPKDLADIWGFSVKLGLSLPRAITDASSKAAGVFPADLARVLLGVTPADHEVVRWISPPPVDQYLRDLRHLGEQLLLGS